MLTLQREPSGPRSTLGKLYADGQFVCHTLEDVVREKHYDDGALVDPKEWKIAGQTAIPSGKYAVVIDHSEHFNKLLPHILGVPGFDGVRIHGGNTDRDTEGCVLVALVRDNPDLIHDCAPAVAKVMQLISAGQSQIEILPAALELPRAA